MKLNFVLIIASIFLSACSPSEPEGEPGEGVETEQVAEATLVDEGAVEDTPSSSNSQEGEMPEEQRVMLIRQSFEDLAPRLLTAALANDAKSRVPLMNELRSRTYDLWKHSTPELVSAVQEDVWSRVLGTPEKRQLVSAYLSAAPPVMAVTGPIEKAPAPPPPVIAPVPAPAPR